MILHTIRQSWVLLLVIHGTLASGDGISCFKCTVTPQPGIGKESSQICSHFQENKHFQIYCPKSTLCMKRTIHHKLVNGTIVQTSVERGCAPQLDVFQAYDFSDRVWRSKEEIVQSAYQPGCFIGEDRGSPGGPPEYCYCGYNLCNGAETVDNFYSPISTYMSSLIIVILELL